MGEENINIPLDFLTMGVGHYKLDGANKNFNARIFISWVVVHYEVSQKMEI
jgi:hypothetical protein